MASCAERAREIVSVAKNIEVFEGCMSRGEIAVQMDSVHLKQLDEFEAARDKVLASHQESARLEGILVAAGAERERERAALEQLDQVLFEKHVVSEMDDGTLSQILQDVVPYVPQVRELLISEQKLVGETSALLEAVVKVTDGVESAIGVHRVAVELQREEQSLNRAASELEEHMQSMPLWGSGVEACVGAIENASVSAMQRLSSEFIVAMTNCHAHLVNLADSATRYAQTLDEEGEAEAQQEEAEAEEVKEGGADEAGAEAEGSARKWQEKRNAYAVSVLKRVKQKIEGRESGTFKMTVADQVDLTIKEATSVDKLCHMYEGWTPYF